VNVEIEANWTVPVMSQQSGNVPCWSRISGGDKLNIALDGVGLAASLVGVGALAVGAAPVAIGAAAEVARQNCTLG